jgi:hypothetical protein
MQLLINYPIPPTLTGVAMSLFALGEVYSAVLVALNDVNMENLNWRALFFFGSLPSACFYLYCRNRLPESPSWLTMSGKKMEALDVLEKVQELNKGTSIGKEGLDVLGKVQELNKGTSIGKHFDTNIL